MSNEEIKLIGKITVSEYLTRAINSDYPTNFQWLTNMFSYLAEKEYEDEYVKIKDNQYFVKLKNQEDDSTVMYLLKDKYEEPIIDSKMKVSLVANSIPYLTEDVDTTAGRLIANYLLILRIFKGKIAYINNKFDVSYIENKYIIKLLASPDDKDVDKKITIEEYTKFIDTVSFLTRLNRFIVHAGGPDFMARPDGIDEYRTKLIAEAKKKYGDDAMEKIDVIGEIDKKLEKYQQEALKDDPAMMMEVEGKTKQAVKKMFGAYGHGGDFYYTDGKAHYLENSLEEGWDDTKEAITVLYNDIRTGSYSRGAETQKGGYAAKQGLRATTDIKIIKGDCGSKVGLDSLITEKNKETFIGRYIIVGGKSLLLTEENVDKYVNKVVSLRSPMFCHTENNFCSTCMGEASKNYQNAVAIMVINMAGIILNTSMKAMHDQSIKLVKLNLDDMI